MPKVALVTDSAADLPREVVERHQIIVVPLYVNWKGETYKDGEDIGPDAFYPLLRTEKVLPSTSQPTPGTYLELFEDLLAQGKDVLCLTLSSGLSGTYSSAITARGMLQDQERVAVVDTLAASIGQGLLVLEAARLAEAGKDLRDILSHLREKISRLRSIFTIDTLENLVKGGRLSAFQGGLGMLLDIKPVLHLDEHGKIAPLTKVRSRKKALVQLLAEVEKQGADLRGQIMGVSHARDPETGAEMAALLMEKFGAAQVVVGEIGAVIGTHTGEGCIALFFYGNPMR
ncbi:MAG: DegV family protein [Bacillota bacterium]